MEDKLKLNDEKMEVVLFSTRQQLEKLREDNKSMWHSIVHSEKYSQGLELVNTRSSKIIIQGLVISKLDYCNGLLLGVSAHQINKLHIVQNMCCRPIKNLRKYDHISDAMKDLHWLKIPQCIQFKILVTIYQCVNGMAPPFVIN